MIEFNYFKINDNIMRNVNYIEINQDFRDKIKKSLFDKQLTKSKFAELVGVNKGTMSQYLNGNVKRMGEDIFNKMIEVLQINSNEVLRQKIYLKDQNVKNYKDVKNYNRYFNLFLLLIQSINENFSDDEFHEHFDKTKIEFMDEVESLKIDLRVLSVLNEKGVDINKLFEIKTFSESYEFLKNINFSV